MHPDHPFDTIVFSGGGSRCFWQAGFWEAAAPRFDREAGRVLAVSAGAAFACSSMLGINAPTLADFKERARQNTRNFYPRRILAGKRPFPHAPIYRQMILGAIDNQLLGRLKSGPEIHILLARAPRALGNRPAIAAALAVHVLNRRDLWVHARWGRRFGFRPELASVRNCETREDLADLILHSSCAPPLMPLFKRGGRIVLDGGMIDNAPADMAPQARRILLLLSRRYPLDRLPVIEGRTYVQPSEDVPVSEWDYTRPDLVQRTYDLGRRDGEAWARTHAGMSDAAR